MSMEKRNSLRRPRTWKGTLLALVLLEFIVSIVMLLAGYLTGNAYFRGVGVGLLISWVTGGLAFLIVRVRMTSEGAS